MFTAETLYGVQPQIPGASAGGGGQGGAARPTAGISLSFDDKGGAAALIDPHNPLVWFGVFLAATLGAIGVSGSARVGAARVAADLGKT